MGNRCSICGVIYYGDDVRVLKSGITGHKICEPCVQESINTFAKMRPSPPCLVTDNPKLTAATG